LSIGDEKTNIGISHNSLIVLIDRAVPKTL